MPVQISEMQINVHITADQKDVQKTTIVKKDNQTKDYKSIVELCVEQVTEILNNKNER